MYLPKSQIKQNNYSNGDTFIRSDNSLPYVGYYWQDSNGKYFSGKTPQDTPRVELILQIEDTTEVDNPLERVTTWSTNYNTEVTSQTPGKVPYKFFPSPSEDDYELGEFQRYFTKKTNQNIYYEISKDDYKNLINQNNTILWQLYQGVSLPWLISGDKQQVFDTNRNIVTQVERQQSLPGFRKLFKEDYLQFYKG